MDRAAFESFGQYMVAKEAKLRRQFAEHSGGSGDGEEGRHDAPLRGVCVWVDGRTWPSREELRALVGRAGGRFETYFHRALVTHVVGTHFPPNKAAELRKMVATSSRSGGGGGASVGSARLCALPALHVVTPQWVVDSVRGARRVPEWRYGVPGVRENSNPALLHAYCNRRERATDTEQIEGGRSKHADGNGEKNDHDDIADDGRGDAECDGPASARERDDRMRTPANAGCAKRSAVNTDGIADIDDDTLAAAAAAAAADDAIVDYIDDDGRIAVHDKNVDGGHHGRNNSNSRDNDTDINIDNNETDYENHLDSTTKTAGGTASAAAAPSAACATSVTSISADTARPSRAHAPSLLAAGAPDADYSTLRSTREDAEFVRKFFAQSRLHFIGSFRTAYESIVTRLQEERRQCQQQRRSRRSDWWRSSIPPQPQSQTEAQPQLQLPPAGPHSYPHSFVLHVDMDAFFVSVSVALRPELRACPVAVCHSGHDERGRAEISSASYEARDYGVRAGMFFGEARRRCPSLVMVPYDFDAYRRTCETVYRVFFELADVVEGISIDEAYLLVRVAGVDEARARAERIRSAIRERSGGCTASAGIGVNKLMARLATRRAKQCIGRDAQYVLLLRGDNEKEEEEDGEAERVLASLPARELPTIGWRTAQRLGILNPPPQSPSSSLSSESLSQSQPESQSFTRQQQQQECTVADFRRQWTLAQLQATLGSVAGERVYNYARGKDDDRPVTWMRPRKSVGAQITWGVRFTHEEAAKVTHFVAELARVVLERLRESGVRRCDRLCVTALQRRAGAGTPCKPLGCGLCDEFARTCDVSWALHTDASVASGATGGGDSSGGADALLVRSAVALFWEIGVPNSELRGVGIHATRLNAALDGDSEGTTGLAVGGNRSTDAVGARDKGAVGIRSSTRRITAYFASVRRPRAQTRGSNDGGGDGSGGDSDGDDDKGERRVTEHSSPLANGNESAARKAALTAAAATTTTAIATASDDRPRTPTSPAAPPDVDESVWCELPLHIRRQVRREMLERERYALLLARWRQRRAAGVAGGRPLALSGVFQPTLRQFHHLRRGDVENTGAVMRVHNRKRVRGDLMYGGAAGRMSNTTKRRRTCRASDRDDGGDAIVTHLSVAELSPALDAFFERRHGDWVGTNETGEDHDDQSHDNDGHDGITRDVDDGGGTLQRLFAAFIDDLAHRGRWTHAYQAMRLLRRKIERMTGRVVHEYGALYNVLVARLQQQRRRSAAARAAHDDCVDAPAPLKLSFILM